MEQSGLRGKLIRDERSGALSVAAGEDVGAISVVEDGCAKTLDLILKWDGAATELRQQIDGVADWGPFELRDLSPMLDENGGAGGFFCRFFYTGPDGDREQFEWNLKFALERIAVIDDAFGIVPYAR